MDFALTASQEQIRQEAAALARTFPPEYWLGKDDRHEYPHEFVRAFADGGWLGLMIPEEYGGSGLGVTEAALVLHEICASGAGTSGASPIHFFMFPSTPLIKVGSAAMKRKYLPRIRTGEIVIAFGVTEPNAGTDTSRIETRAERRGDVWVINGHKVWTTNAQHATKILLLARTTPREDTPDKPLKGMTLFFADLDRRAVTVREIPKLGRAAVDSNELFIEDLEVPDEDVVGTVGEGFYHLLDSLNPERIVIAMEAVGIGRAALARATAYAKERIVFDRPIGKNQAIAHPLAHALAALDAAELMSLKAAWLFDHGLPCGREANAAKVLAAEAGFDACDAAVQTLGGFGYAKEFHVERLWREVRLYKIAPVSQQMALNYLAEHALGLPKSY
jgi:acyl-CoA dehydrogenase